MRILAAIDASQSAADACRVAAALAAWTGARLTILHVAAPGDGLSAVERSYALARAAENSARCAGEALLAEARALVGGLVAVDTELRFGDPAKTIVERARELDVDIVVTGSRGLGLIDRVLLGSVGSTVAQNAPCSVLIVRSRPAPRADRVEACAS